MELSKIIPVSKPICRLSDPENPHNLCRRFDPPLSVCFSCKGQQHLADSRYYYYCATCDLEFHRGCHLFPPEIKHPLHLLHPLTPPSQILIFKALESPLTGLIHPLTQTTLIRLKKALDHMKAILLNAIIVGKILDQKSLEWHTIIALPAISAFT